MTEFCPLSGRSAAIGDIPTFCHDHCGELWDQASKDGNLDGEYDHYGVDPSGCMGEMEHSHEALQSVDDSALRIYSTVDQCMDHEVEVGEQAYYFECPHNPN